MLEWSLVKDEPRETSEVTDHKKIAYVIKEYLAGKLIQVKGEEPDILFGIVKLGEDGRAGIKWRKQPALTSGSFEGFITYKRHMVLHCSFVEGETEQIIIEKISIAKQKREHSRVGVDTHEVYGHHFYISKNRIDLNKLTSSVSNRVIFAEFEKQLQTGYPQAKIMDMDLTNDSIEKKILKKYQKGIFVPDIKDIVSPESDRFVDIASVMNEEIEKEIREMKNRGICSWMVRPLCYTNITGETFPVGYMVVKTQSSNPLSVEDYNELAEIEEKIIEKIKDANTILLNKREKVINLSMGGALLEVEDKEFQEYLLNRTDLTFDLLFKYQAGLRFHARIKHIASDQNKIRVGLDFHGVVIGDKKGKNSKKLLQDSLQYIIKQGAHEEAQSD